MITSAPFHGFLKPAAGGGGAPDYDFAPFSPTLWLAADDMVGFADGGAIGAAGDEWDNLGSAGGNFAQGTPAQRPTYEENEINTVLPVVRFSNTPSADADALISTANLGSMVAVSAYTIFIVCRPTIGGGVDASARYYRRPRLFGGSSDDTFHIGLYDQKFALNHNSVTGPKILTSAQFTLNAWSIVEANYDGTTMRILFNGANEGTIAGANLGALGTVKAIVGRGTDLRLDADIAEIVGWNSDIGSTDRTTHRNGLATKYNITI